MHIEAKNRSGGDLRSTSPTARPSSALTVGGQAVIEGIMMRSPNRISIAVRKPDDEIVIQGWHFVSLSKRSKFLGLPVIRGVVNLAEMLYWGVKTLQLSAQIALGEEAKASSMRTRILSTLSMLVGLALGVALFAYLPLLSAGLLGFRERPLLFNLFAGTIRVILFLGYLTAISFLRDIKRLFQYHGAEHKTIHAFERGEPLAVQRVQRYSTLHPRCGTSFILIVAIVAILFFAAFDTVLSVVWGFAPKPLLRLPIHLVLLPIVAGLSYEVLKLSDKLSRRSAMGRYIVAPGLWLQRITTKPPDDGMVEVAIKALMDSIQNISLGDGK